MAHKQAVHLNETNKVGYHALDFVKLIEWLYKEFFSIPWERCRESEC